MDIQEVETILKIIRTSRFKDFADTLIKSAIKYAHIRAEWCYLSQEEKNELEDERRIAHDALISNCDILARNMKNAGEDNSWRAVLGNDRKRIGDFACLVHAIYGIQAK
jgi:hypothetical protein